MKKFFASILMLVIFFANFKISHAYENFWYDRNVDFKKFAKIVIFPLSNNFDDKNYLLGGEGTKNFKFNSYIHNRLKKNLNKVNFIKLSDEIREFSEINKNNLGFLLKNFENENERANAVENATMADSYIVPSFRENRIQEDISPRREWDIELKSWTEERNGPDGNRIFNEKSATVHHVIPEKKIYLHIMQLEFAGYDNKAEKIMTSLQENRKYNVTEEGQFQGLVKEFQKVFDNAKLGKIVDKSKTEKIKINLSKVNFEVDKKNDDFYSNALNFSLQEVALSRIKNAKINLKNNMPADYKIFSEVTRFDLIPTWHEPNYQIKNILVSSSETKWTDKKGKEHTMTTSNYTQTISDIYAYWSFTWAVNTNFKFFDKNGEVIFEKNYKNFDDKAMDAYRHAAENFCKKIDKILKK